MPVKKEFDHAEVVRRDDHVEILLKRTRTSKVVAFMISLVGMGVVMAFFTGLYLLRGNSLDHLIYKVLMFLYLGVGVCCGLFIGVAEKKIRVNATDVTLIQTLGLPYRWTTVPLRDIIGLSWVQEKDFFEIRVVRRDKKPLSLCRSYDLNEIHAIDNDIHRFFQDNTISINRGGNNDDGV